MLVDIADRMKRMMGWCPQQDFESMQFQTCAVHAPSSSIDPIGVNSKPAERMDVPLHSTGNWGIIPVIFALCIFFMAIFSIII